MAPGSDGVIVERVRSVDGLVALYVVNCLPAFAADAVIGLAGGRVALPASGRQGRVLGRRAATARWRRWRRGRSWPSCWRSTPAASLAYIESVTWDQADRPIDCYRAWLRTDRMRLEIQVSAQPGADARLPYLASQVLR